MKRHVTDPAAMAHALAGRLDILERTQNGIAEDVTALGRGVAALTAQIRALTTAHDRRAVRAEPSTLAEHSEDCGDDEPGDARQRTTEQRQPDDGQRDWLAVTQPEQAAEWLAGAQFWAARVLTPHGLSLTATPCWPLHPDVVGNLLALIAQREDAYATAKPGEVSEWLTRWLPAGIDRIRAALKSCAEERGHRHDDSRVYDTTALTLIDTARWWTTSDQPAPEALTLPRLT